MEEPNSHDSLIFSSCLVTHCCGIASYSSTHIYYKAASVVVLVTLAGLAPSILMPQAFSCVDIRTAGRSFHALHTYILDLVSDKLHSVWVKRLGGQRLFPDCGDMDCHWLQKLILISSSTEITRSFVFSLRKMLLFTITLPPPKAFTVSVHKSAQGSPHPLHTLTLDTMSQLQ